VIPYSFYRPRRERVLVVTGSVGVEFAVVVELELEPDEQAPSSAPFALKWFRSP